MAASKGKVIEGNDEGQQDTVPGFDFAAWIGEASRPEREVVLYAANALQADIARLERERDEATAAGEIATADPSWGDPTGGLGQPVEDRFEEQIRELQQQIAASKAVFRVRAIDSEDIDAIARRVPMPKGASDDDRSAVYSARGMEQMAAQVVSPRTFTVAELTQIRKAIGEVEFLKLFTACQEVMSDVSASTPFWHGNSGNSLN